MRSLLVRLATVAAGIVGLLGVLTPPAQARTESTLTFTGAATLSAPLGYPCAPGPGELTTSVTTTTPPFVTVTNTKCPQGVLNSGTPLVLTTKPLLLPGDPIDQGSLPYVHGGNTRSFGFGSTLLCVNAVYNIDKPLPKHNNIHVSRVNGGDCAIAATGSVTGWCGLSTGLATGTFVDALGNGYAFRIHFYGVASELVITGHWTKPGSAQTGLVVGAVNAVPIPDTSTTPPGNSCAGKTATEFTVTGAIAAVTT